MFLQEFCKHPNIIRLHSVHRAINNKDIYLVFEYMETDLHNIIERGNILRDIHRRYITYQLLKALKYIHSGNVIHRDLKPSNILLNGHCHCKIADFGLARSVVQLSSCSGQIPLDPSLTDYVATRWYRAPEILVAAKRYTKGIDMWSIGCILAEMLLGKPLFPGTSTINQVEKIMATIEPPSPKDNPRKKKLDIAKEFGILRSTLATILKKKEKFNDRSVQCSKIRKIRSCELKDVEECVVKWLKQCQDKKILQ
ncbi:Mitogen-activated protein kinase 15 [Homalodisca vitripennis]|nr:Mitogen-activated protein kinase 15 [Homalodisca vitripennis]